MRAIALTLTLAVGGLCFAGAADAKATKHHQAAYHHRYHHRSHHYTHHKTSHHSTRSRTHHRTATRHHTHKYASHHHRSTKTAERLPWKPADGVVRGGSQIIAVMHSQLGRNPTGWGHQWCGHYLDMVLRETGHRGGGNLAAGYAHYGRPCSPQVGAIAVMPHHVGVVMAVGPGYVTLISGNHGHKVGIGKYPRARIMAFRMPA